VAQSVTGTDLVYLVSVIFVQEKLNENTHVKQESSKAPYQPRHINEHISAVERSGFSGATVVGVARVSLADWGISQDRKYVGQVADTCEEEKE
jgi:hypothetical protein